MVSFNFIIIKCCFEDATAWVVLIAYIVPLAGLGLSMTDDRHKMMIIILLSKKNKEFKI